MTKLFYNYKVFSQFHQKGLLHYKCSNTTISHLWRYLSFMNKFFTFLLALIFMVGIMAGCGTGTTESQRDTAQDANVEQVDVQQPEDETAHELNATENEHNHAHPAEPEEGTTCSMCNMEVYLKNHEMGKFTGQVVTADGQHLYTDDLGCLLNQIRILEEKPQGAWVRDYDTLEWIPVEQAIPVRASIETPMKMGFALFGTEEAANNFATQNPMLSPVITTMKEVDKIALERRKAKLAKMKEAQEKAANQNNSEMKDTKNEMNNEMHGNMNQ